VIGFDRVYVATAEADTAATINAILSRGPERIRGVVLTPGVYSLIEPIRIQHSSQVLLGLGLATLVSARGTPCVVVGNNVDDVRIGGILVDAGEREAEVLVQVGDKSGYGGKAEAPTFLYDVFLRVGAGQDPSVQQYRAKVMLRVYSGHVVGDDVWLWRGDHTSVGLVRNGDNPCAVGVEVIGDDVVFYGLAIEHTLQDQLRWSGERGRTYYYQCELPYDVTRAADWRGARGFVGYRVLPGVRQHEAHGVGVYSFFRDAEVWASAGIRAPAAVERSFVSPFSRHLDGNGGISSVINGKGQPTREKATVHYCPS